ncbi:LPS-assembly protein LptD [Aestuariicoccus sp. MJ-SS9]|uniref:LPS-assembly protein LptD n=1 Tax=Aestuariicoccus sp. MJ-SS9 TaxID=3079855 RepID=UPI002910B18F|nr:LPS assembly protein LptD [Aestuariicoccus sp. MJ-SS9]MDU8910503.1 LPS assembly protein LptD [Aestuariicoccus sp. MJ-SS9]
MRWLILALLLLASPLRAQSSDAALLVADAVFVEAEDRLIAQGNVEALFEGNRLTATRIVYDRAADALIIEGPLRITDPDGNVFLAEAATLDPRLRDGLLTGARLVLDQQLQLAAVEARRAEGRYTQLSRVAVTSCQVCGADETPLWQIRANRVVHDEEARQIYFEGAQLRILDVPVAYLPYLRLPDPTLRRARGFLIPSLRSSTLLGFGIKTPYFIPIGDHQDITLTPYLSPVTRTLEARYRRAFTYGDLQIETAITRDTLAQDQPRGYLFAEGAFDLPRDFKLTFDIEATSDEAYLSDYDYSSKDRLDSELSVTRVRRDDFVQASLIHYESLRDGENNATQPTIIADLRYERRFFPRRIGGELRFGAVAHAHHRYSTRAFDGPDDDLLVDGLDLSRLNADLSWRNRWTLAGGLRAGARAHLWIDRFEIRQDVTSPGEVTQATPAAAVELRWPFARTGPGGGRTLLEPVVQLGWTGGDRQRNPNDESTVVEFDEGNLLSLSRYPAADRRERGGQMAVGLRWLHDRPGAWRAGMTLGRVWRDRDEDGFSLSSGLQGDTSDWLIAGRLATAGGLSFSARGLLDSDFEFSNAEARAGWSTPRMDLGASYVLLVGDLAEGRNETLSEWSFDGRYRMARNWTAAADWRYDLADGRFARAGLGLEYRNECVEVNFSVSRRFVSSTNLEPTTDVGLTVALKGFSTGGSAREYRRTCSN